MGFFGPFIGCCIRNSQPNIKPRGAGIIMVLYGVAVITLGVYLWITASSVIEKDAKVDFEIPEDMSSPVFVFLNYEDFYQNHRAMISSMSRKQIEAHPEERSKLESVCKGALTNTMINKTMSWDGKALDPQEIASPCGFMAKNFPFDSYKTLTNKVSGKVFNIADTNLVMSEEREKFVRNDKPLQWVKVDQDRFINWMKSSSTSNFYKLWGRIDENVPKGQYSLVLDNMAANVWQGKKNIVLSTTSKFGGKKYVPAIFSIGLGVVMVLVGAVLLYLWVNPVKPVKDTPLLIDDGY